MRQRSLLSFVTSDMPDPALNDRPAVTETFDIMPDYGNLPPCPDIVRGAVLVAGISNLAQVSFDLTGYQPGPDELDTGNLNEFSVAEALAWRNVFVVLVNPFGYGESQFDDNGAQPTQLQCNTSRQGFLPDGGCNSPAGCDRTGGGAGSGDRSFPAGLQTSELGLNPECAHTTNARFTNTRGFARSIHQAVLHAKALSGVGKVSMWDWSAGGVTVAYYARRTTVIDGMNTADNVDRIVLHASAYNALMPSDGERPERPADGYFYPTFPITVRGFSTPTGEPAAWGGFAEATAATCPGQYTKTFAPIREHLWLRNMEDEPVSSSWGKNGAWDPPGTLVGACDMCYNITHDVHDCTCADGCTPPAPGPLLRRQ